MSLVLDASLTLSWYFEDEQTPGRLAVLDLVSNQGAMVPSVWHFEISNSLLMAMRRARIERAFVDRAIRRLELLPITVDPEGSARLWTDTFALAEHHRLTIYDAAYLELALRRRLPMASLDQALCQACKSAGVATMLDGTS